MKWLSLFLSLFSLYPAWALTPDYGNFGSIIKLLEASPKSIHPEVPGCEISPLFEEIDPLMAIMKREQLCFPTQGPCRGKLESTEGRIQLADSIRNGLYKYCDGFKNYFLEVGLKTPSGNDMFQEVTPVLNAENIDQPQLIDFPEKKVWLQKVKKTTDSDERCQLLKYTLAHAIWSVGTTTPLKTIDSMKTMFYDPKNTTSEETSAFNKDTHRALSAFRYLASIPKDQYPESCKISEYGNQLKLWDVFQKRYQFIVEGHKEKEAVRYPLGMAVAMCGRPMNSHYLDMTNTSDEQLKAWQQSWEEVGLECDSGFSFMHASDTFKFPK